MTPPDSPSPRTEAGKPFTFERWLAAVHEDHNGLIWTTKDELRAVFEHEFHAEAAQEAPAPEGLNLEDAHAALAAALLWLDGDYRDKPRSEFNREAWAATARKVLAALVAARQAQSAAPPVPEDGRPRLRDHPAGVEAPAPEGLRAAVEAIPAFVHDERLALSRDAVLEALAAAPPSPAEPPRPPNGWNAHPATTALPTDDDPEAGMPYRVFDRAEARPPEGLDDLTERLAAALPDALSAMTEGDDEAPAPQPSDEPGSPYVLGLARTLAVRLSARGAEPR